ncbi:MAG: secreted effector sseB domain protein [Pseudomonadota bacterium]|jgi:secreted effector protein SseB
MAEIAPTDIRAPVVLSQNSVEMKNSPEISGDNVTFKDNDKRDSFFEFAYSVMMAFLVFQNTRLTDLYQQMQASTKDARNTQEMANRVDEVIAKAAKGDDKTREEIPKDVIDYMTDNGILVNSMTIKDYIKTQSEKPGEQSGLLDKGSLQAIKAALDNRVSAKTDLSTQLQMNIQKIMQVYNALTTQLTELIKKLGELLGMIAQKMF